MAAAAVTTMDRNAAGARPQVGPMTFTLRLSSGRTITGPDEISGRRVAQQIEDQTIRRTMWPEGSSEQMSALAKLFPTMTRWDGSKVPGTDPWDPHELVHWLNTGGEPTSGSRHAAMFLLSVWNRDDWCAYGSRCADGRRTTIPVVDESGASTSTTPGQLGTKLIELRRSPGSPTRSGHDAPRGSCGPRNRCDRVVHRDASLRAIRLDGECSHNRPTQGRGGTSWLIRSSKVVSGV